MDVGGFIVLFILISVAIFFILGKLGFFDGPLDAYDKVKQMKSKGDDPSPYLDRVFGNPEHIIARLKKKQSDNSNGFFEEYDDPVSQEIDSLKLELSSAKNTIVDQKVEIAALKKQIEKLTTNHCFNRDVFTEFFEAVKHNYSDEIATPKWRADAFVYLYNVYLSHYSEIEKRLSSFLDCEFASSKTDIIDLIQLSFDSGFVLSDVKFRASARVKDGDTEFLSTLSKCNCNDFVSSQQPCKHMLALARRLDISWVFGQYIRSEINRSIRYESLTRILKKRHEDVQFHRVCVFGDTPPIPSHRNYQHITPDLPDELVDILKALEKE